MLYRLVQCGADQHVVEDFPERPGDYRDRPLCTSLTRLRTLGKSPRRSDAMLDRYARETDLAANNSSALGL